MYINSNNNILFLITINNNILMSTSATTIINIIINIEMMRHHISDQAYEGKSSYLRDHFNLNAFIIRVPDHFYK